MATPETPWAPISAGKLSRHTVRPCAQTHSDTPRSVVLVPPGNDLDDGFDAARRVLETNAPVRLVGVGVTLPRTWPVWVHTAPGLWLTELYAYASKTLWDATQPLRAGLRSLTDELFEGAFADLRGSEVFYPQIGIRAFAKTAWIMPVVLGLSQEHAGHSVTCIRPEWPGFRLYKAMTGVTQAPQRRSKWVRRVGYFSVLGWAASLAHIVGVFAQSRVGLLELRRRQKGGSVSLWLQLSPDWPRINAALIEATQGRDLGILLHGHVGRGERKEARLAARSGGELWPGLRGVDATRVAAWGTTSVPPSAEHLVRACAGFTRAWVMAALRLCKHGPVLRMGPHELDIMDHARDLSKLVTIDLARACTADSATADAIQKHDFRGSAVLSAGALAADTTMAMRRLRRAGATTVDFAHGWAGEPEPFVSEPASNYRCVWSRTDTHEPNLGFLVGGMPIPQRLPRPPGPTVPRILLMTNYLHRDTTTYQIEFSAYLDELLDIIRSRGQKYAFRWRPHPADVPDRVSRFAQALPAEVSQGRSLAEDLSWADVVVSTRSTSVAEALLVDVPVLVHVTPDIEEGPIASLFSPERTFFLGREGLEKLDAVVGCLGQPDLLAPERCTRRTLFGDTQAPRPLTEAMEFLVPPPHSASLNRKP